MTFSSSPAVFPSARKPLLSFNSYDSAMDQQVINLAASPYQGRRSAPGREMCGESIIPWSPIDRIHEHGRHCYNVIRYGWLRQAAAVHRSFSAGQARQAAGQSSVRPSVRVTVRAALWPNTVA